MIPIMLRFLFLLTFGLLPLAVAQDAEKLEAIVEQLANEDGNRDFTMTRILIK